MKHLGLTLQDKFEYQGYWWLPETSSNRHPGTLYYDPNEGVKLSLVGSFTPFPPPTNDQFHGQIIHGITVNGIKCTLVENFEINQSYNAPGIQTQEIHSNLLFLGESIGNEEQLMFSDCRVSLEQLEEWMKPRPFKYSHIEEDGQLSGVRVETVSRRAFEVVVEP